MDVPSRLDFHAIGRDRVVQTATKIDPAKVDTAGSDVNIFVGVGAFMCAHLASQLAYRTAALTLDGSDDEDLDRYAYDRYNEVRKGASPARGSITIARESTTAGAGDVPIGTVVVTDTGVEYVTTTTATFGALATSGTANVRAAQAGKATQVGAGSIQRFAQPQSLFDATLTCTNPLTTAGGEDAESDSRFRDRMRDFWRTARRGVIDAIEFGALTVPGVVSARAVEALTSSGLPARIVNLYISDSSGVASEALAQEVRDALLEYRGAGVAVLVFTSAPLLVDIKLRLRFLAGVDTLVLTDEISAAIFEFVNSLAVNGTLYRAELFSVLQRFKADGLIPNEDTIVAPVGDLVPAVGQTIRTTLANIEVVP